MTLVREQEHVKTTHTITAGMFCIPRGILHAAVDWMCADVSLDIDTVLTGSNPGMSACKRHTQLT